VEYLLLDLHDVEFEIESVFYSKNTEGQ